MVQCRLNRERLTAVAARPNASVHISRVDPRTKCGEPDEGPSGCVAKAPAVFEGGVRPELHRNWVRAALPFGVGTLEAGPGDEPSAGLIHSVESHMAPRGMVSPGRRVT